MFFYNFNLVLQLSVYKSLLFLLLIDNLNKLILHSNNQFLAYEESSNNRDICISEVINLVNMDSIYWIIKIKNIINARE